MTANEIGLRLNDPKATEMSKRERVIDQLRGFVRDSGAKQADIARDTGIDPGVISRFARGERGLNAETFSVLCGYFDLELRPRKRGS